MTHPTGEQFEILRDTPAGQARAIVTQVAAGLRAFTLGDIDLIEPFPVEATPPSASGIVLVPWPNRVKDARWTLHGDDGSESAQQLAVTEPAFGNASHGLLRFTPYTAQAVAPDAVTLGATIFPQTGYPFLLETSVTHRLSNDGLVVEHTIRNDGDASAPVALGAHPYLKIGDVPTERLLLTASGETHYDVDERMNVTGVTPVAGTAFDLRSPRRVGELSLDDGFGGADPTALATLAADDGRSVTLWGDENVRWVQVFTHRGFATLPAGSVAIALEPMTAPANALNSGEGLRWLAPGETWSVRWGIRPAGF